MDRAVDNVAARRHWCSMPPTRRAYWNVLFKSERQFPHFLRTGTNPAVHLRLKWGLPTNNAWNMNVFVEGAQCPLNAYVTASTSVCRTFTFRPRIYRRQTSVDLSGSGSSVSAAAGNYRDRCVLNISALDLVPSATQLAYTEFVR